MEKEEFNEPDSGFRSIPDNNNPEFDNSNNVRDSSIDNPPNVQRVRQPNSENDFDIGSILNTVPSEGLEAKVKDLQDENAHLRQEVLDLKGQVRSVKRHAEEANESFEIHRSETNASLDSLQKANEESSTANAKLNEHIQELREMIADLIRENRELKGEVRRLTDKDREKNEKFQQQDQTNSSLLHGANQQQDAIDGVHQKVKVLEENTDEKLQQSEKKTDEKIQKVADELRTVKITADNAVKGVNDTNLPGGLQQAGRDESDEPLSDGNS